MNQPGAIDAVLFDKDGTLFEFGATWNNWAGVLIDDLSRGDPDIRDALCTQLRYDLAAQAFLPDSPVIAGTNREAAECCARALPGRSVEDLESHLIRTACEVSLRPPVPLVPLLESLAGRGLRLGVVTNDAEAAARAHLEAARVTGHFDFVAGFDSGFGMKPAPDPLLAFSASVGIAPERVVMVGDSTHDLIAGRSAGMVCVGVLTGMAMAEELTPFADAVLAHIGHLPDWLYDR